MSVFAITFDPALEPAKAAVTAKWIRSFDSTLLRRESKPELLVQFWVDGDLFCYYSDTIDGIVCELMGIWSIVQSGQKDINFSVQVYTVLCAQRIGEALQFYDPAASYEGASLLPLDRLRLIGDPVPSDAVELAMREAIAALWQRIERDLKD